MVVPTSNDMRLQRIPLTFSSSLFLTVVLHAIFRRQWLYAWVFLNVAILSINYHWSGELQEIDMMVAHLAFMLVLMHTISDFPRYSSTLWYLGMIVALWHTEEYFPKYASHLHFALHILAVAGMHAHLRHGFCYSSSKIKVNRETEKKEN